MSLQLLFLSYWVCEKSDGIRLLLLVATEQASGTQSELTGLFFPHHENPLRPLGNTIVDGELVLDVDPRTKKVRVAYASIAL